MAVPKYDKITVWDEIWRLEHRHGLLCEEPLCNQLKEVISHKPGAKSIIQRSEGPDPTTQHCYYPTDGRSTRCFWHNRERKEKAQTNYTKWSRDEEENNKIN